jgi:AcrR family transcriptional regulator
MALEQISRVAPPRVDRDARRDALLEAAATEFNARGVSRASVSRIAKAKGLTRAAVYYYVRDRDDLVFQAYRRSCEVAAANLAAAIAGGGDAMTMLTAYIRAALDPNRPPTAVLSELDYLQGPAREAIARAHGDNVETLRGVIRSGVGSGVIRPCDDEIIAQTLVGLVAWVPVSVDWVEGTASSYRARTVEALVDLITNGQAVQPGLDFASPISISAFFPAPPNPFDRPAVAEAKIEHLLMTASQIFNRRGVDGASLEDVVRALGATTGALYHYLDNKMELVVRCHERATDLYERIAETADRLGRDGLEKASISLHLLVQAHASGLSPMIHMAGNEALPAPARTSLRRRNRALQQRNQGFGELGQKDGSLRPMDFAAVSQLGAGAFEWLPKWFDPADPRAGSILANEIVGLFRLGLRRR